VPRAATATAVIEQIRREHASVNGVRRQLGTGWRTVWESIKPLLAAPDADPCRFEGVKILGVDEHVWLRMLLIGAGLDTSAHTQR